MTSIKKCFICKAGPRGLRVYERRRVRDKLITKWICAEWLVPCYRRNNVYGRKIQARLRKGNSKQ